MDLSTDQLLHIAFDAAATDQTDLPAGLRERVLGRALAGAKPLRHRAWADPAGGEVSALSAFITTAAELADLVETLAPEDWARITRMEHASVREVVVHLVGVERYVLGQLGRRVGRSAPRREDHWPVTQAAAADMTRETSATVAQKWWHEVLDVIAACGELGPDHEVAYHHLSGSVRGLLIVRTFELWTHGDDIRQATGRPLNLLDERRLSLMVDEFVRVLPLGLALSGGERPGRTARIQLNGAGGGTFDVPLSPGDPPGEPDITFKADVIALCRLAANRLDRSDFHAVIEGDGSLLEPILVGAAAFAAD